MKKTLQILIGVAILIVVLRIFSVITGLLFWGLVAVAIGAAVLYAVRKVTGKDEAHTPPKGRLKSKAESDIDRLIKDMERMTGES